MNKEIIIDFDTNDAEEVYGIREIVALVRTGILECPEIEHSHRRRNLEIIDRFYLYGQTWTEIAREYDMSPYKVKGTIEQMMKIMAAQLTLILDGHNLKILR